MAAWLHLVELDPNGSRSLSTVAIFAAVVAIPPAILVGLLAENSETVWERVIMTYCSYFLGVFLPRLVVPDLRPRTIDLGIDGVHKTWT